MSDSAKKTSKKRFDYSDMFYSDISLPDMLYAVLVRSPVQCGAIQSIEVPPLPENVYFFSAKDIPGENTIQLGDTSVPVFASDSVSYLGQPMGILVGPDESALTELVQTIGFSIDGSSLTFGLEFSDSFSNDQLLASRTIIQGEPDTVYAESEHQFEQHFSFSLNIPPQERNGILVHYSGKQLNIYSNSHWTSHLRKTVSAALGIGDKHIILHKTFHSESRLNDVWLNSITAAQVAVASFHLKKPIKLVYSINEQTVYMERTVPAKIRHRTSVDENGLVTSMDVCIVVDAGAYNPFIQYVLDRFVIAATGVYAVQNLRIDAFAIKTNYPPLNSTFIWGDSQSFFAIENHMTFLAQQMKMHIMDFKSKNFLSNVSAKTPFYCKYDAQNIQKVIDVVVKKSDFLRKNAVYSLLAQNTETTSKKYMRGIGLAASFCGNVFAGSNMLRSKYTLETTLEIDGSVTVKMHSPSDVLKNIWTRLICKQLELKPEQVRFFEDSPSTEESAEPDVLPSNITIMTQLLKKCCTALQRARFRQPLPISVKKTFSSVQKNLWNAETFSGQPFQTTTWAAAVAEVEIDPATYDTNVRNIWIVIDGGEMLDEKHAANTVKTTVSQILKQFIKPYSLNTVMPDVSFLASTESPKEIEDVVYNTLPAAFTEAVSQALMCPVTELPLATDSIFKLITKEEAAT